MSIVGNFCYIQTINRFCTVKQTWSIEWDVESEKKKVGVKTKTKEVMEKEKIFVKT